MAALSYTAAATAINSLLRNGTVYLALFLSDPGPDATGTEVNGGAYTRKPITFGSPSITGGKQTTANSGAVSFPVATNSWGDVAYWAVYSASSGGNMIAYGAFSRSKSVDVNDTVTIPAGELVVTFS